MARRKPKLSFDELLATLEKEPDMKRRAALFKKLAPELDAKLKAAAKAHWAEKKRRRATAPLNASDEFRRMWNTTAEYVKRYAVEVPNGRPVKLTKHFAHDLGGGLRVYYLPPGTPQIARQAVDVLNSLYMAAQGGDRAESNLIRASRLFQKIAAEAAKAKRIRIAQAVERQGNPWRKHLAYSEERKAEALALIDRLILRAPVKQAERRIRDGLGIPPRTLRKWRTDRAEISGNP